MKTVFFTGRRPKDLCGYEHDNYVDFVRKLTDIVLDFYNQGYKRFISGGAQGFDQLAFWAVNNARCEHADIENIVYVPFKGQSRAWNDRGLFSQHEYNLMLKFATEIKYLQPELHDKNQIIKALYDRNHQMVDNADIGIALYPTDDWNTSKGGTAECIRYAKQHNKPVFQIKYNTNRNILRIASTQYISQKMKGNKDMKKITEFRNENYFLSNMFPAPVLFEGIIYPCVETAFQAAKVLDPQIRRKMATLDGYKAKKEGRRVALRKDWENIKMNVMYQCVLSKFTMNESCRTKLLATGDAELIEENTWNDTFWGVCNDVGKNNLGRILMYVREELREYEP